MPLSYRKRQPAPLAGTLALAFVLIAGLVLPATNASAAPVADASCSATANANFTGTTQDVQVFTALHSGKLTSASVQVVNSSAGNDYVMGIMPVDGGGVPIASFLATKDLPDLPLISSQTIVTGDFAVPAQVEAGKKYGLSFQIQPGQGFSIAATNTPSVCPAGGTFFRNLTSDPFSPASNRSMLYSTTVEPDPPVAVTPPAPTATPAAPPPAPDLSAVPSSISLSKFLAGIKVQVAASSTTAFEGKLLGTIRKASISVFDLQLASATLPAGTGTRSIVLKPNRRLTGSPKRRVKVRLSMIATNSAGLRTTSERTIVVKPKRKKTHKR